MADVFVSYAMEDRKRVKPIVEAIGRAGYSVWWDRQIILGSRFEREIERELEAARCVVVIWSAHSVDSDWVRAEAQEGLDRHVLIPILVDDVKPPLAFRRVQTAVLSLNPADRELAPVLAAVETLLHDTWATTQSSVAGSPAREALHDLGRTIAVLPFRNLSADPEQEYFVDGIAEDLIARLSRRSTLRVIARTSSFQFKNQADDAREIGRKLSAAYLGARRVSQRAGLVEASWLWRSTTGAVVFCESD